VVAILTATAAALTAPAGGLAAPSPSRPWPTAADGTTDVADMFRLTAPVPAIRRLAREGYDVAATRPAPGGGLEADLVLFPHEAERLSTEGLPLSRWTNAEGKTVRRLVEEQAADGYSVWRSYDEPGGLHDELVALAQRHPELVQYKVIGQSVQGREIVALRVTRDARAIPDGARPAVLYVGLQHAREWISGEVVRRLLHSLVDGYETDLQTTRLLEATELWFVPVANPDGYERSFSTDRLWRKNVADNDGDGRITHVDGVDPNRNFPDHWGYDPEGSSPRKESPSYRGPRAASEPETAALMGLAERVRFRFLVNYHSFGRLLLYPYGWQIQTPATDQPLFTALAGTAVNPAIPGYKPQLAADLYITNGETMGWAYGATGVLGFTVELGEGLPGNGFLFPDNEALVRQEYELNRPFAIDVANSAPDPAHPRSHLGTSPPNFVLDPFPVSYGDPQPVRATVARGLGSVSLEYRVNGGPVTSVATEEWQGGERFGGPGDVHYRVVQGEIRSASPGDQVEAWFEGGGKRSPAFSYRVESGRSGDTPPSGSGARVLVVAGGNHWRRTGPLVQPPELVPSLPSPPGDLLPPVVPPVPPQLPPVNVDPPLPDRPDPGAQAGQARLGAVLSALSASGVAADVYDVEAHGHLAPHPLGVLGHYAAVVWTTDEFRRGALPGPVSRLANEEVLAARAYLNEGGRLLYMGRGAGRTYARGEEYDPKADGPCNPQDQGQDGCVPLSDDFFQYWLGAYDTFDGGGGGADTGIARVDGVDVPFLALAWAFTGPDAAPGGSAASYLPIADALGGAYPSLSGRGSARYRRTDQSAGRVVPNAAALTTPGGILFGFGFEDIASADQRAAVMARVVGYLLALP
jgi:hypothetical protein